MKITQRLVVLFLIVSISFGVLIYLFFLIKKQEGRLYSQAEALQRRQIINAFIDIKKNDVMRLIDDNSIEDGLLYYTKSRSQQWAKNNLSRILIKNDLDFIQVYDTSGIIIFSTSTPNQPLFNNFRLPPDFFNTLYQEKRKYFTEPWQQQFLQIGASTIHASSDSSRVDKPGGFLLFAKLWNVAYLEDFSQTLDYNVTFYTTEPSSRVLNPNYNVNLAIPLQGWDNKPVAWLRFSSNNPFIEQWQSLGKQMLLGILGFTLAFLILQFALLYYWIRAPLLMISNSLKNGNPEIIVPLSKTNNEFGEIANLIKRFFEQNQLLRSEVEERRKTENMLRQAQKMESIGTMAGGIAHDFNNIITIISGYISLASAKADGQSEVRNNLDEAMLACFRAKKLIEKILTFTRSTDRNVQPVYMKTMIQETMAMLEHTIPTSITIKTNLRSEAYVLADPTEMLQVVLNVSSNSYHAMRYQGGTIDVELFDMKGSEVNAIVHTADANRDYVCISVKDTGSGIPQEILDRIFDPYFSTKAPGEGTGLGLSIVHGIVSGNGGYININSVVEHGTTVKVFFPVTTLREIEEPDAILEANFIPAKLYFIDDEVSLTALFEESLTNAGYDVTTFNDSNSVYNKFLDGSADCDLLIADISMPGLNGIQLAEKIRQIKPNLPIIIYSGYTDTTIQQNCRDLGINKLLLKPILPDTLSLIVKQILAEQKPAE